MRKFLLTILSTTLLSGYIFGQTIKNVQARPDGYKVIVTYDLIADVEGQKFNVELRSSINNFSAPLKEVEGDVGPDQTAGTGKVITWNAIKEMGNFTGTVTFEVVATVTFTPLAIISPDAKTKAKPGKELEVKWKGGDASRRLKMAILRGSSTLAEIPDVGSSGHYTWQVPKTFEKGSYQVKLFDPGKPKEAAVSAEFQLRKTSILVYIVPGAVVAGALTYLLISNGGGDDNGGGGGGTNPDGALPEPPPPPGGGA